MSFTLAVSLYLVIGLLFALYSEYEYHRVKNDPLMSLILHGVTGWTRTYYFFATIIGWPVLVIKSLV